MPQSFWPWNTTFFWKRDSMSSLPDWGDFAHSAAKDIFDLSSECLMAHSVRAVEEHLARLGRQMFAIRVRTRRNFAAKAQSPALAYIFSSRADIVVDADIGKEWQRRAIAHELGHIVIAFEEHKHNGKLKRRADALVEGACSIFEQDLCARHHKFNSDNNLRKQQLFVSLADHPLSR